MSELTLSAVGDGQALGDTTPVFTPANVAPPVERHASLNYSLLDQVYDAVQRLQLSPKSQKLHDFETLVTAQKAKHHWHGGRGQGGHCQGECHGFGRPAGERPGESIETSRPCAPPVPLNQSPVVLSFGDLTLLLILSTFLINPLLFLPPVKGHTF